MLVDDLLKRSALRWPDRVGLVCGSERLIYRDIDQAAERLGNGLNACGVRRGDRVVVYAENSVETVLTICGTLRAGGVVVPIGPTVKADKLRHVLDDCEPTVLVVDARTGSEARNALREARRPPVQVLVDGAPWTGREDAITFERLLTEHGTAVRPRVIDLDLAALMYTSGSTSRPKGVMLTHLNVVAAARSIGLYLQNTEHDVILNVLPLSFDYGLYQVFLAFQAGATLVLERSFVYPGVLLERVQREQVTGLPLVPTLLALLLRHDLSSVGGSLRYITSTGAAVPPAHIAALRARLPHVEMFSMYGLTECKRVSYLAPKDLDSRPASVGKPMDNVEVYVEDEHGRLSATGEGELLVRGSNVMAGYWRAPELTDQTFRPGLYPHERLLRTGDRFRIADDGYLYYLDRLDDVFKSRGQRVSPKEVEHAIYELPGVIGVAVVGTPDEVLGMAVSAFVCCDEDSVLTAADVMRHCVRSLEAHMVPATVTFVDELPRTASGKIDRRRVLAALESTLSAE